MKKPHKQATLSLHGSLVDFVSRDNSLNEDSKTILNVKFTLSPALKDLVESKGIPHTAIFGVQVNGVPSNLHHNITDADVIELYPIEETNTDELEPVFIRPTAFVADMHLSKLAGYLRLLGLDTVIPDNISDAEFISLSNTEQRMILTRDIELLRHGSARYGYWVRSTDPDTQLDEVLQRFDLSKHIEPFTRCMVCNGRLEQVDLVSVKKQVPPKVREWCNQYHRCRQCRKVYWKGSHYEKLKKKVEDIKGNVEF